MNEEKPKTAQLTYTRGAVAVSPVRQGLLSHEGQADPLNVYLSHRKEQFPGVARDIFRMENPVIKPKEPRKKVAPPVHVKTQEEIAAEAAQAAVEAAKAAAEAAAQAAREDLSKFRFLGYLTDKESTLFLSKDDELFIAKRGDIIQKRYKVKEAKNDFVVLLDTTTGVELRVALPGGELKSPEQNQDQTRQRTGRVIHRITRP